MRVYLRIQVVGYKPVSDAHLKMGADRATSENRGILRLDSPDFYAGILRLKHFAYAAKGSASSDSRAKAVNRTRRLLHDFKRSSVAVCRRIRGVRELLGNKDLRILFRHALGNGAALRDGIANVARIMDEYHLGAVVPHELAPFLAHAIRHDDHCLVALHRTHKSEADSLVAARRLDNDRVRL